MADLKTPKYWIALASFLGALAVILGAFGAHYLKTKISAPSHISYTTAVQYQFIHSVVMLIVAFHYYSSKSRQLLWVLKGFLVGIICFSGSIYFLSTRELTEISFTHLLGPITPIGGIILIFSWLFLSYLAIKGKIEFENP